MADGFDLAELIETGVLEVGDGYRAKNSELGGDGPIFLRAGHVRDTHIDLDGVDRFRRNLARAVASKMSAPGDVIVHDQRQQHRPSRFHRRPHASRSSTRRT